MNHAKHKVRRAVAYIFLANLICTQLNTKFIWSNFYQVVIQIKINFFNHWNWWYFSWRWISCTIAFVCLLFCPCYSCSVYLAIMWCLRYVGIDNIFPYILRLERSRRPVYYFIAVQSKTTWASLIECSSKMCFSSHLIRCPKKFGRIKMSRNELHGIIHKRGSWFDPEKSSYDLVGF